MPADVPRRKDVPRAVRLSSRRPRLPPSGDPRRGRRSRCGTPTSTKHGSRGVDLRRKLSAETKKVGERFRGFGAYCGRSIPSQDTSAAELPPDAPSCASARVICPDNLRAPVGLTFSRGPLSRVRRCPVRRETARSPSGLAFLRGVGTVLCARGSRDGAKLGGSIRHVKNGAARARPRVRRRGPELLLGSRRATTRPELRLGERRHVTLRAAPRLAASDAPRAAPPRCERRCPARRFRPGRARNPMESRARLMRNRKARDSRPRFSRDTLSPR